MQPITPNIQNNLPSFLVGTGISLLKKNSLNFIPIKVNGRINAEIHWLFKPEQTNDTAAAIIRYYPGGSAPSHIHTGYELIYILEGEMNTSTGKVKENDLILLEPGSIHNSSSDVGCTALIIWQKAVQLLDN